MASAVQIQAGYSGPSAAIIAHALRNAGYRVRRTVDGGVHVSKSWRPVGPGEIDVTLGVAGYVPGEYRVLRAADPRAIVVQSIN